MSVAAAEPRGNNAGTITYEDLYRRWEDNNWSAMGLDFSRDRAGRPVRGYHPGGRWR